MDVVPALHGYPIARPSHPAAGPRRGPRTRRVRRSWWRPTDAPVRAIASVVDVPFGDGPITQRAGR
jgi:hypothetical protein